MSNYYRIAAYHPDKNISIIMDSYGMFEKKWQFSADLIKRGLKILEVSDDKQFLDGNIERLTEEHPNKFILRASAECGPTFGAKTINGEQCKTVSVGDKTYYIKE